jgi:uncharacterized DUF497 family protein
VRFEWDPRKDRANRHKHGVNFDTARRVFDDPLHISVPERMIDGEQRWQTVGKVEGVVLLLVAHTVNEAENDVVIRIISARKATKHERKQYEQA